MTTIAKRATSAKQGKQLQFVKKIEIEQPAQAAAEAAAAVTDEAHSGGGMGSMPLILGGLLLAGGAAAAAGGGGGTQTSATPVTPTVPVTPTTPTTPTTPITPAGPSSSGAMFEAAQKIQGVQIGIPYTGTPGNYKFDYNVEGFYVSNKTLSVLPSYFPQNGEKSDVYIKEMSFLLNGTNATKMEGVISTSMPADCVEVADFNGDGYKDVFIGDTGYDAEPFPGGQNKLIFGSANGFVDKTSNLPKKLDFTHSTTIADIDGDGDLDIYVGNIVWKSSMEKPYFLINDGKGVFTEKNLFAADFDSRSYTASLLVDLDGDRTPELVLGGDRIPSVIMKLANGQYNVTQTLPGQENRIITDIVSGDLNKDGTVDLIVSSTSSSPFYKGTVVDIYESINGTLAASKTYTSIVASENRWNDNLYVTDVNRDGYLDVVSTGFLPDTKIFINNGKSLSVDTSFKAPWDSVGTAVEMWDVNGDNRLDFVYTAHENPTAPNVLNMGVYVMFG